MFVLCAQTKSIKLKYICKLILTHTNRSPFSLSLSVCSNLFEFDMTLLPLLRIAVSAADECLETKAMPLKDTCSSEIVDSSKNKKPVSKILLFLTHSFTHRYNVQHIVSESMYIVMYEINHFADYIIVVMIFVLSCFYQL